MYPLLLTSDFSDDFGLDYPKYIGKDSRNRIIKAKVSSRDLDLEDLVDFFISDSFVIEHPARAGNTLALYCLERFFERLREIGKFDEVSFVNAKPGASYEIGNNVFEFLADGKAMHVYDKDKSHRLAEIFRVVEIRKRQNNQAVICDVKTGSGKFPSIPNKIAAVRTFLGSSFTFSYMICVPIDTFRMGIVRKHNLEKRGYQLNSDLRIEDFLAYNHTNLCLVFSPMTPYFNSIGSLVLEQAKDEITKRLSAKSVENLNSIISYNSFILSSPFVHTEKRLLDYHGRMFKNPEDAGEIILAGYRKIGSIHADLILLVNSMDFAKLYHTVTEDRYVRHLAGLALTSKHYERELLHNFTSLYKVLSDFPPSAQLSYLGAIFEAMPTPKAASLLELKSSLIGTRVFPRVYISDLNRYLHFAKAEYAHNQEFTPEMFEEVFNDYIQSSTNLTGERVVNSINLRKKMLPGSFEAGKRR